MNTLYVNYTKSGIAVGDSDAEDAILHQATFCVNGADKQFNVSTENVIRACQMLVLQGKITCSVVYMFEGEPLVVNKFQVFKDYPKGFLDYTNHWLMETIKLQFELSKKEKNDRKNTGTDNQ